MGIVSSAQLIPVPIAQEGRPESFQKRLGDGSVVIGERTLISDHNKNATITKIERFKTAGGIQESRQDLTEREYTTYLHWDSLRKQLPHPEVRAFIGFLEDKNFTGNMPEAIRQKASHFVKEGIFPAQWEAEAAIQIAHAQFFLSKDPETLESRIESVTDLNQYDEVVKKEVREFRAVGKKFTRLQSEHNKLEEQIKQSEKQKISDSSAAASGIEEGTSKESTQILADSSLQGRDSDKHASLVERFTKIEAQIVSIGDVYLRKNERFYIMDMDDIESGIRNTLHKENMTTKAYLRNLDLATREHTLRVGGSFYSTTGDICMAISDEGAEIPRSPLREALQSAEKSNKVVGERYLSQSLKEPLPYEGVWTLLHFCPLRSGLLNPETKKNLSILRKHPSKTKTTTRSASIQFFLKLLSEK